MEFFGIPLEVVSDNGTQFANELVEDFLELLAAENTKIILLTGTPIINYPNEIAILFNILRGYIISWELTIHLDRGTINKKKLE